MKHRQAEQGSAIVYVFMGIALFGALMFLFSRGASQNSSGFTKQQSTIKAQSVIEYGSTVANAVTKLMTKGISENDISFATDIFETKDDTIINPASQFPNCVDATCKVFDKQGGGATAQYPSDLGALDPDSPNDYPERGGLIAHVMGIEEVGTTLPELVLSFYTIPREVCAEINNLLNNQFTTNPPVGDSPDTAELYVGAFPSSVITLGDAGDVWAKGKTAYCYQLTGKTPAVYVYQKVALVR